MIIICVLLCFDDDLDCGIVFLLKCLADIDDLQKERGDHQE